MQQVTTPHFHNYNSNGISIAYKTDQLKNERERVALEDINLCVCHFCMEANLRVNPDEMPSISILPNNLPLTVINDDPNQNIDFI